MAVCQHALGEFSRMLDATHSHTAANRDGRVKLVPLTDTSEALAAALPDLAPHSRIAIDTEADSLHCYFEKLCLIQISVPDHDLLIDPLANFSLAPLFESFAGKELAIHGADYDLRLLRRAGYAGP